MGALFAVVRGLSLTAAGALLLVVARPASGCTGFKPAVHVPAFWQRLAACETGSRWDWGRYANTPQQRHLEGTRFEGGLGFAAVTWHAWARELRVLAEYPHAWMAPPEVQVRVAAYGLTHGGYWGCLGRA